MTAIPVQTAIGDPGGDLGSGRLRRAGVDVDVLAARARDGDSDAFELLVVATSSSCYQLAYRLVGNEHDARDVMQETYLRAYRGLKRFRGDCAVTTWLYRITANSAARLLQRRARSATSILDESVDLADLRPERDPESAASASHERTQLVQALAGLPDTLRVVVVLRDIYDLSHREIARELGISQSAAKVRLHRGRRLLRERIFPGRHSDSPRPSCLADEASPDRRLVLDVAEEAS
ncbi:MAG: RNA polymerase sigma factor [Acidimicrobiales bacterium]